MNPTINGNAQSFRSQTHPKISEEIVARARQQASSSTGLSCAFASRALEHTHQNTHASVPKMAKVTAPRIPASTGVGKKEGWVFAVMAGGAFLRWGQAWRWHGLYQLWRTAKMNGNCAKLQTWRHSLAAIRPIHARY